MEPETHLVDPAPPAAAAVPASAAAAPAAPADTTEQPTEKGATAFRLAEKHYQLHMDQQIKIGCVDA